MTSEKVTSEIGRTVAHWGGYEVHQTPSGPKLEANRDDSAPAVIGRGWLSAMLDEKVRVLRPAIRKGWLEGDHARARCRDDAFVQVPWDEALDLAAAEIDRVRTKHGNGSIFAGSYGWASAGRFHHCHSQLRRFLNLAGGFVAQRDTYSHAAAEVLFPHITGLSNKHIEENATSWPLIADNCTLMLAFGGISSRTSQIASGGTWAHEVDDWMRRAANNGMQTVNISPLKSDLAEVDGVSWLPIRPGSDVALILALAHELIRNDLHDQAFLDRYVTGADVFKAYVMGESDGMAKHADWAAEICDVDAEQIVHLARRLAQERVMITVAWGVQRADHGEQPLWAALALACLLGQIGQPGLGFGFGYGSTTPPGRPKRFISWPAIPQGENAVGDYIPVSRITDMFLKPGEAYRYNGAVRHYPDIKLVYWGGGNPFHHHQDLNLLETAWQAPDTVIVQDHSWTATARRADIVLPATSPLEREDLFLNRRDPNLIAMCQVIEPIGEARNDHDIFRGLAQRLGFEEAFAEGRSEDEWKRWMWARCEEVARTEGFELPNYDTFMKSGHVVIPEDDFARILFEDFIRDPVSNPLKTPSGRIEIFSQSIADMELPDCAGHPTWMEPQEWLGAAKPQTLHLISNQPISRLHSQLDNGAESRARKVREREICMIHPDTGAALGLVSDDIVRLYNPRGACLAAVKFSEAMRRDVVQLSTGAWLDLQETPKGRIDVHGNPNVLTIDKGTSGLAQGNIAHTALVDIEKWSGPLPEVRVFSQPRFVEQDVLKREGRE